MFHDAPLGVRSLAGHANAGICLERADGRRVAVAVQHIERRIIHLRADALLSVTVVVHREARRGRDLREGGGGPGEAREAHTEESGGVRAVVLRIIAIMVLLFLFRDSLGFGSKTEVKVPDTVNVNVT